MIKTYLLCVCINLAVIGSSFCGSYQVLTIYVHQVLTIYVQHLQIMLVSIVYTITLCTSSALTCLLRYVKRLTGYGGSSSNHTQSSLFVY
jgi:hypothetical protein